MKRNVCLSVLLVVSVLFVVACGGESPSTPATPAAAKPTAASENGAAKPTAASENGAAKPTAVSESGGAPESTGEIEKLDLKKIDKGIDALKSYRMTFKVAIDGKDKDGKAQKGSIEILTEAIKDSKDQHMRMSLTGDMASEGMGEGGTFEIFQVEGMTYMYSPEGTGEQKCMSFGSAGEGNEASPTLNPSEIVGGVDKAKLVKKGETINGIVTDHYTFDQTDVVFGDFSSAKGDVWVAQDGGYIVKYTGEATGKDALVGSKMSEGTITWNYMLEDVNAIEKIELPKECADQKPATDIPIPENATEKSSFGTMITFKSPDKPADVAAFFKEKLPAQGWEAGEVNSVESMEMLTFTKEGRKLSITITSEEKGGSSAMLSEEKA